MIVRFAASVLILLAATTVASAERRQPPEKVSPRPVQPRLPPEIMGSKLYAYSRWTKFCGRDKSNPDAPQVCLTVLEVKRHAGGFAAGVALIEGAGDKKVFRVTLPAEVRREAGARVAVDGDEPLGGKFLACTERGCLADFEANAEFIARLKTGEVLHLRGTGEKGQTVSYRLPLAGFVRANAGLPSAPPQ